MEKWGYIRETPELVKKAYKDNPDSIVGYTCMTVYISEIFPDVDDWIQGKCPKDLKGKCLCRYKPDFYSPTLNLIIEIDGLPHYSDPENVLNDKKKDEVYTSLGFKVVRIPYFIQLDKRSIKTLFGITVDKDFFNIEHPSMGIRWKNTPAYLCPMGIERMCMELKRFPDQFIVNYNALKAENNTELSGVEFLEPLLSEINICHD